MIFVVIKNLLPLFSHKERRQALWILSAITLGALIDVLGIASLFPYMTVVSKKDLIDTNYFLRKIRVSTRWVGKPEKSNKKAVLKLKSI